MRRWMTQMMIENSSMHAPYVRMGRGSYRVMCDVLIAMIPPIVWAVYVFGGRAVTMIVVGVTFASAADYSFRRFIFRKGNDFDVSAAVTGILIGFALPVSAPLWLPAFAALVAICVKYSAGGIGKNLFNPAASGICVSYLLFGKNMTVFTKPFASLPAFALSVPDAVLNEYGVATSLDLMRDGKVVTSSIADYFYGIEAGAIGTVSAALLTVSLVYLLIRRVSGVGALAGYLMGMLVLTFFTAYADCEPIDFAATQLFSGGIFLVSVFMLSDYATSPSTMAGKIAFGVVCAAFTVAIRYYGMIHYGEYFALLVSNMLVPVIDKATWQRVYGSYVRRNIDG